MSQLIVYFLLGGTLLGLQGTYSFAQEKVIVSKADPIRRFTGHDPKLPITCVAFSPNGKLLASTSRDGTVRVWNVKTGELVLSRGIGDKAYAVAFSHTGWLMAVSGSKSEIVVYTTDTWETFRPLKGHEDQVTCLAFSPVDDTLASGSRDKTVRIWKWMYDKRNEPGGPREIHKLTGHKGYVTSVAFAPDGKSIVSGGTSAFETPVGPFTQSDHVRVWQIGSDPKPRVLTTRGDKVAVSADGRTLAVFNSSVVDVNKAGRGQIVFGPKNNQTWVDAFDRFSLLDLASSAEVLQANGRGRTVCFSSDGKTLATGQGTTEHWEGTSMNGGDEATTDLRLTLWDVASSRELVKFDDTDAGAVAFSPDGRHVASGNYKGQVVLREVAADVGSFAPLKALTAERAWADLAGEPLAAFRARSVLLADAKASLALIAERLRPVSADEEAKVKKDLEQLNAEQFAVRQAAERRLRVRGLAVDPVLRETLGQSPSEQVRTRLEVLLADTRRQPGEDSLRASRAVQILEQIGTKEAAEVLKRLGKGSNLFYVTQDARRAGSRLNRLLNDR